MNKGSRILSVPCLIYWNFSSFSIYLFKPTIYLSKLLFFSYTRTVKDILKILLFEWNARFGYFRWGTVRWIIMFLSVAVVSVVAFRAASRWQCSGKGKSFIFRCNYRVREAYVAPTAKILNSHVPKTINTFAHDGYGTFTTDERAEMHELSKSIISNHPRSMGISQLQIKAHKLYIHKFTHNSRD